MSGRPSAIITGASRGLGLALARELAAREWRLVIDGRGSEALERAAGELRELTEVEAIAGDVSDAWHREVVALAGDRINLLVNNASVLGPSPQPELSAYRLAELERVYRINVLAPLALIQLALPQMRAGGCVINITSDAAVEPYPGWGGYGSAKAALEQLTAIFGAEHPEFRVYSADPGDMRTQLHQEAFPGEDVSDRPLPEESVPGLLALIEGTLPSGRYPDAGRSGRAAVSTLAFELLPALEAGEPPEARGLRRDEVRLMVARRSSEEIVHTRFRSLPDYLSPGDLLVINNSATLPAAVPAVRADGTSVEVRFSTRAPAGTRAAAGNEGTDRFVVELRSAHGVAPLGDGRSGEKLKLPGEASVELMAPYAGRGRLWLARFAGIDELHHYLNDHGHPIRYGYVRRPWPLSAYQTVYATVPGSAEMPSAGRPFTAELLTRLIAMGALIAPVTLHAGVSSPEAHEPPYPEFYEVPVETARLVNHVRGAGHNIVAIGTTVVRALESAVGPDGTVEPRQGWTNLVISEDRPVQLVDGLLTGWHEPRASHLRMLEVIGGERLVRRSYEAALVSGYLWHEFGDSHLILP